MTESEDSERENGEKCAIDSNPPSEDEGGGSEEGEPVRRSARENKGVPPLRLVYLTENETKTTEPTCWGDVLNMRNPNDRKRWVEAARDEIHSLNENKTWVLVDAPPGKPVIGCKWTFKLKRDDEGHIVRYKARLVGKGYSQKFGQNFDETFAPVVSHATIRATLAAAIYKGLEVNHIDIKTAFLNGDLNEEIYMSQPPGFEIPGSENKVCKLQKSIYGLKQAARAWNIKIAETLEKLGFTQSNADPCLYTKLNYDQSTIYLIVYVDDILIVGSDKNIEETIDKIGRIFKIKNLGRVKNYLGMEIKRTDKGCFAISQRGKINELIEKFKMTESKPVFTPMEPGYMKTTLMEGKLLPNNTNYRQAIGGLLYIGTVSRPDILAPVSILSRKNETPREQDWEQVKRVIKYLKTTKDLDLIIDPNPDAKLVTYADADWAGDSSDRKSTSGNVFKIGKSPIHWCTKKQTSVATSSAEAEFISAASAAQETMWLIKLCDDLGIKQNLPIKLYEDNVPCIKLVETPSYQSRLKHIDIKLHLIKDLKMKGVIDLHYCASEDMPADLLTKPTTRATLERLRQELSLVNRQ